MNLLVEEDESSRRQDIFIDPLVGTRQDSLHGLRKLKKVKLDVFMGWLERLALSLTRPVRNVILILAAVLKPHKTFQDELPDNL